MQTVGTPVVSLYPQTWDGRGNGGGLVDDFCQGEARHEIHCSLHGVLARLAEEVTRLRVPGAVIVRGRGEAGIGGLGAPGFCP